jgi:signal peptidase I
MPSISLSAKLVASLAAEIIRRGRNVRLPTRGESMHPTVASGDHVVIAPTAPEGIQVGDVVMVAGDRPWIHRVVRIDSGAGVLVTKGDDCAIEDPPIKIEAVVGRVVGVTRPVSLRARRFLAHARAAVRRHLRT